jgi:hypothetical protein
LLLMPPPIVVVSGHGQNVAKANALMAAPTMIALIVIRSAVLDG